MYRDRDFDLQQKLPSNEEELTQDLEINTLVNAMALGDKVLLEVAKKAVVSSLNDLDAIQYRQDILRDCLKHDSIVREIYDIAVESIDREKKSYWSIFSNYPDATLRKGIEVLQIFVGMLKELRNIADEHADEFESEGFTVLFAMLKQELGEEYFASIQKHLKQLKFRDGVLISAELGKGNKGTNYVLRKPKDRKVSWMKRFLQPKPAVYTFHLHPRDESGARALSELNDRGINLVANALAQSADHILSFFSMLRTELAFYVGCLNLYKELDQKGVPMSFPMPVASGERRHSFNELYDACLALSLKQRIVGNRLDADNKDLVVNHGRQPGRQIDVFAKRRCGPIDDAMRYVCVGGVFLLQRLRGPFHALQTGRRRCHEKREI
jgi:DNA mismatch repair ATPase MutS